MIVSIISHVSKLLLFHSEVLGNSHSLLKIWLCFSKNFGYPYKKSFAYQIWSCRLSHFPFPIPFGCNLCRQACFIEGARSKRFLSQKVRRRHREQRQDRKINESMYPSGEPVSCSSYFLFM